jgi:hypothetical protein
LTGGGGGSTVGPVPARVGLPSCLLAAVIAVIAAAGASGAASPVATAAQTCSPPKYPGSGYFISLSVKHTSCSTGRRLAIAYYRCRTASGPKGRCRKHVMGYACKETRQVISIEIDARVTCRDGSRSVVHRYQQNT